MRIPPRLTGDPFDLCCPICGALAGRECVPSAGYVLDTDCDPAGLRGTRLVHHERRVAARALAPTSHHA